MAETVKVSPLDARIDSVGRQIAYGNLWIALPGLKTLLAEAQMSEDEEALQRIALLAALAEAQNPDKTRRALGDELERLRSFVVQVEDGHGDKGRVRPRPIILGLLWLPLGFLGLAVSGDFSLLTSILGAVLWSGSLIVAGFLFRLAHRSKSRRPSRPTLSEDTTHGGSGGLRESGVGWGGSR